MTGTECFIKDLIVGESIVKTEYGNYKIISLQKLELEEEMFDPEVDSDSHLYWSNGILSHNTTIVSAFLFYNLVFNKDFNIAILANKGAKSRDILAKIRLMYEMLPWWLKPGVVEWNKGRIQFSNGSTCYASATSNSRY